MRLTKLHRIVAASLLSLSMVAGQVLPVAAPAALLGGIVISQTACPLEGTLSEKAGKVSRRIESAIKIFKTNNLATDKLERAKDLSDKVRDGFKNGEPGNALEWLRQLIDIFENEILTAIEKIKDPLIRTLAMVALHEVNNHLRDLADKADTAPAIAKTQSRARAPRAVDTIERFKKKPNWKCRNSITGRYASMDYCREFPATSTVETN
jgi:hypothetical protein